MSTKIIPIGKKIQSILLGSNAIAEPKKKTDTTATSQRSPLYSTHIYKPLLHIIEKGLHSESQDFISGHPLEHLILKPLGVHFVPSELKQVVDSLDFKLGLYDTGTIPASTNPKSSYSEFAWTRDMANKVLAMIEMDCIDEAKKVIYALARFNNEKEQRNVFYGLHLHESGKPNPHDKYQLDTNSHPHIRAAIDANGLMVRSQQPWGHNQLDAIGAWLYVTFYLANKLSNKKDPNYDPKFLKELDTWLTNTVNKYNGIDSIFSLTFKALNRIECWNNFDVGPWEDIYGYKRASSIGICLKAAQEAKKYFDNNNWNAINIHDVNSFKLELTHLTENCSKALEERIPNDGSEVKEIDRFPSDAALTLLLEPFNPGLSEVQEQAILKTLYEHRMGVVGFTRRDEDDYVGMDYPYNIKSKGIFSDLSNPHHKAAEWTLFDPLLATFYYKKFNKKYNESKIIDNDILLLAELHLKRTITQITKEEDSYIKRHEDSNRIKEEKISVPHLVLPEAYWFDSTQNKWRPNENSPLLWSEANFILMMKEALKAAYIMEKAQSQ